MQQKRLIRFQESDNYRLVDDLFVDLTIHDVSAILLDSVNLEDLITHMDEATTLTILAALTHSL